MPIRGDRLRNRKTIIRDEDEDNLVYLMTVDRPGISCVLVDSHNENVGHGQKGRIRHGCSIKTLVVR